MDPQCFVLLEGWIPVRKNPQQISVFSTLGSPHIGVYRRPYLHFWVRGFLTYEYKVTKKKLLIRLTRIG